MPSNPVNSVKSYKLLIIRASIRKFQFSKNVNLIVFPLSSANHHSPHHDPGCQTRRHAAANPADSSGQPSRQQQPVHTVLSAAVRSGASVQPAERGPSTPGSGRYER